MTDSPAHPDGLAALALEEAVNALGLIKAEAISELVEALSNFALDPGSLRALRKAGTQLSPKEKLELGLSVRAFMSQELLAHLTQKGSAESLVAHELTLQRASFSLSRAISLKEAGKANLPMLGKRVCPDTANCAKDESWSPLGSFGPFPPVDCGDGDRRTCRSTFVFRREGRK